MRRKRSDVIESESSLTDIRDSIRQVWSHLLGKQKVLPGDNFFALGGHSMTVVKLVIEMERAHGIEIFVPDVLDNPTAEEFATYISEKISALGKLDSPK